VTQMENLTQRAAASAEESASASTQLTAQASSFKGPGGAADPDGRRRGTSRRRFTCRRAGRFSSHRARDGVQANEPEGVPAERLRGRLLVDKGPTYLILMSFRFSIVKT
jgi:hypothetical protein